MDWVFFFEFREWGVCVFEERLGINVMVEGLLVEGFEFKGS